MEACDFLRHVRIITFIARDIDGMERGCNL